MKLVAVDLDGTLLNKEGHVPEENAWALKNSISKGEQSPWLQADRFSLPRKYLHN